MKQAIAGEVTKSAPPVVVTAAAVAENITLNEWVAIATIVYVVLQAGYLVWKWYREYKA